MIDPEGDLWNNFSTHISSIYFDSPELRLYHERLSRSEGARLLRARWYGEKRPKGTESLFLELKTHHEPWINDDSTKERVKIQEAQMTTLLDRNQAEWSYSQAMFIAKSGDPTLASDDLESATDLLLRIRDLVTRFDLRPCVRTCYSRVSFQSSNSNALRLTVDRDIKVYDETAAVVGQWFVSCLPQQAVTVIPCAVFEVKLAGKSIPQFVEQLDATSAIQRGYKFSKFLTGVSLLRGHSGHVRMLPYWANEDMFKSLYTNFDVVSRTDSDRLQISQATACTASETSGSPSDIDTSSQNVLSTSVDMRYRPPTRERNLSDIDKPSNGMDSVTERKYSTNPASLDLERGLGSYRDSIRSFARRRSTTTTIAPRKRARVEVRRSKSNHVLCLLTLIFDRGSPSHILHLRGHTSSG